MAVTETSYTSHFLEVCPVPQVTTKGTKGWWDLGLGGVSSMPSAFSQPSAPLRPKVSVLHRSLHPGSGRLHSSRVALVDGGHTNGDWGGW